MENKKDMAKSIIVLSVIALIAGLLLSVSRQFTIITPEEELQRITAKLNEIHYSEAGYEEFKDEEGGGVKGFFKAKSEDYYIVLATGKGFKGKGSIQLYVSFEGDKIVNITVGSCLDTPGIKDKAVNESYLEQYYTDITNKVFALEKYGGDFDSASGATYTSRGVIEAISNAVTAYRAYLGGA